jgi:hypothetical protein
MVDQPTRHDVVAIADAFLGMPSEFGLYEVCAEVKYNRHVQDDGEVKRVTLEVVREMLRRGVQVGHFDSPGWLVPFEGTHEELVARIDREWTELGHMPSLDDICWFAWYREAFEADKQARLARGEPLIPVIRRRDT